MLFGSLMVNPSPDNNNAKDTGVKPSNTHSLSPLTLYIFNLDKCHPHHYLYDFDMNALTPPPPVICLANAWPEISFGFKPAVLLLSDSTTELMPFLLKNRCMYLFRYN